MTEEAKKKWECDVCGFVYDAAQEGVAWEELPDDWVCPVCGASKSEFHSEPPAAD